MPPLLALLPVVLGLAGTGIGLGESLANKPGSPAAPSPADTAAGAEKTKQTQLAALSQQTPNIQAATGGALSPDAWAQLSELLSGQAGNPGIGAAGNDLITKLLTGNTGGGTVSAGSATGSNPPGTGPGLTNTTFG